MNRFHPFSPASLLLPTLSFILVAGGCSGTGAPQAAVATQRSETEHLHDRVTAFCGDCHKMPAPDSFPKDAWYDEVERGYEFYFSSGRNDLQPPPMMDVVRYFRDRAPARLQLSSPGGADSPWRPRFRRELLDAVEGARVPAVSHLLVPGTTPDSKRLIYCDMRLGDVRDCSFGGAQPTVNSVAQLNNPCHITPGDLDNDGRRDYVIADLGSFYPADHDDGRVVWLHRKTGESTWVQTVLYEGVGRVADVQLGDFDADGDVDLIVAAFGWRKTGGILLLSNEGWAGQRLQLSPRTIDPRHGSSHIRVCDLNSDGHLDFVALISQEHEVVEAFMNDGRGAFESHSLYSAGDPGFGSSGMELVDLDQDGDLDVLGTSGDSFDSMYLKPYHGIHWLENEGQFPFRFQRLANLPGAYRAVAGDMDQDGDLDIVATTFVPRSQLANVDPDKMESLLILEQHESGKFLPHLLQSGNPRYAAMDISDLDRDGDLDIVAGTYASSIADVRTRLTVWWNDIIP